MDPTDIHFCSVCMNNLLHNGENNIDRITDKTKDRACSISGRQELAESRENTFI